MDRTRHKALNEQLERVNRHIDNIYRKRDILHSDAHLLGITVEKPKELLMLEKRQNRILTAIADNFGADPDLNGFESVGDILVQNVRDILGAK